MMETPGSCGLRIHRAVRNVEQIVGANPFGPH